MARLEAFFGGELGAELGLMIYLSHSPVLGGGCLGPLVIDTFQSVVAVQVRVADDNSGFES